MLPKSKVKLEFLNPFEKGEDKVKWPVKTASN